MKIKRRKKKSTFKIKRRRSKPKKRYTKGGHFIVEDKPWRERLVPCRGCKHWNESMKMYIAKDGAEGWICPIKDEPKLHNDLVICQDYDDKWVTVHKKTSNKPQMIDERKQMKIKRRRKRQ